MRHADSDGFSKQISYHTSAEFLPNHGAMYFPITCTVKKIPYVFTKAAGHQTCSYRQRLQCRTAWRLQQDTWNHMILSIQQNLEQFTTHSHPDHSYINELHNALMPSFQHFFRRPLPQLLITTMVRLLNQNGIIVDLWLHKTNRRYCILYRAWYHCTQFHTLKRKHHSFIKQLKKQHIQDLIREVDEAAHNHDSFKIYNIISRFSPKQPRKKIRIRSDTGAPASAEEVRCLTQDFIRTKWAGPSKVQLRPTSFQGIPFSVEELAHEIAKTPAVKSVAPPFLPGIVLKPIANSLAQILYRQLELWWTADRIFVLAQWRHAWVAFLPKPNKPLSCLDNLRAIALMEPIGKNVLGIITQQLKSVIHASIVQWPQFAYVEFRSAHDAIRHVSAHCLETRQLLRNQQRNVHQRAAQTPSFQTCGGI